MSSVYDPTNIFAKILRGEIPCHKVYEDDDCIAFMDIMPQVDGHTLVLPKAPSRNVLDADPVVLSKIIIVVQKIAKASMVAFQADGCRIVQFNEAPAGQTIFHLHMHVMPIKEGIAVLPHSGPMADHAVLADHAIKLRAALNA